MTDEYAICRKWPSGTWWPVPGKLTDVQVKHLVDRFLMWPLPSSFMPDNGISFDPTFRTIGGAQVPRNPVGTNLLDAQQAEAMVRYMLEGMPGGHFTTDDLPGDGE